MSKQGPRPRRRRSPPLLACLALALLALCGAAACAGSRQAVPPPVQSIAQPIAGHDPLAQATEMLREGPRQDPQAALVLLEGRSDRAARLLVIQALRRLERFEAAVAEANRLIMKEPRLPAAFVERALALAALGHQERALEDCEAALVLEPANLPALLAQGDLYFALQLPDLAEASYSKAIKAAPAEPLAWINRGVSRDEQGRFAEAIADFTRALELDPGSAPAFAGRGVSRSQAGDMSGMCADYIRACALGICRRLEDARAMGYCDPLR